MILTKKQTKALDFLEDDITTEVVMGGGAGGGKSFLGTYWLLKQAIRYPQTRWLMGRSKLKTLKQTTLVTFWKVCKIQNIYDKTHYKYNAQSSEINFKNGSVILLKDLFYYPSDPEFDELGSLELTGAFIDEINQVVHKAKVITKTRIRHGLEENNLLPKLLGTCNPSKNWVKSEYYTPYIKNELPIFRQFVPALLSDNNNISKHYKENLLSTGDNATIQRLLYGNWDYDDDPSLIMDYDSIIDLWTNHATDGHRYISADIARYGSDWFFVFVWNGWKIIDWLKMDKSGSDEVVLQIERLRRKHNVAKSNVICDQDGVGGGVIDFGKYKGFANGSPCLPEPSQQKPNFASLADQCAIRMAEKVCNKEIEIKCKLSKEIEERLIEEFQVIKEDKVRLERDSKRALIKKSDLKLLLGGKSTDIWDAFKMRYFFELKIPRRVRAASI